MKDVKRFNGLQPIIIDLQLKDEILEQIEKQAVTDEYKSLIEQKRKIRKQIEEIREQTREMHKKQHELYRRIVKLEDQIKYRSISGWENEMNKFPWLKWKKRYWKPRYEYVDEDWLGALPKPEDWELATRYEEGEEEIYWVADLDDRAVEILKKELDQLKHEYEKLTEQINPYDEREEELEKLEWQFYVQANKVYNREYNRLLKQKLETAIIDEFLIEIKPLYELGSFDEKLDKIDPQFKQFVIDKLRPRLIEKVTASIRVTILALPVTAVKEWSNGNRLVRLEYWLWKKLGRPMVIAPKSLPTMQKCIDEYPTVLATGYIESTTKTGKPKLILTFEWIEET